MLNMENRPIDPPGGRHCCAGLAAHLSAVAIVPIVGDSIVESRIIQEGGP